MLGKTGNELSLLAKFLKGRVIVIDIALDNRPVSSAYEQSLSLITAKVPNIKLISRVRTSRFCVPIKRPSFNVELGDGMLVGTYDGPPAVEAIVNFLTSNLVKTGGDLAA
ncbi:hypothetical protein J2D73_11715 [Acetobacter sacchari]|uniref:Uncharacterized protein n=1 Tax=Acetobacter sacchari TaxID=2661687 RepID=A0ABS3LWZ9_9PROT|nr:hypothetical protein [Acetobacter sacchari]MBO1360455.1 hypothetical protein [Acetobacter sacchari]